MERGCSRDLQEKFRKGGISMSTTAATLESPLFIAFSILYRDPGCRGRMYSSPWLSSKNQSSQVQDAAGGGFSPLATRPTALTTLRIDRLPSRFARTISPTLWLR